MELICHSLKLNVIVNMSNASLLCDAMTTGGIIGIGWTIYDNQQRGIVNQLTGYSDESF